MVVVCLQSLYTLVMYQIFVSTFDSLKIAHALHFEL